jgi:hypothetical protein
MQASETSSKASSQASRFSSWATAPESTAPTKQLGDLDELLAEHDMLMPASDEKSASNNAASLDLLEDVMLEEIDAAANMISPLKQHNQQVIHK